MQLQLKDGMMVVLTCCVGTAGTMYQFRHWLFPDFSDVAVQLTGFLPLVLESHPDNPVSLLIFLVVVCLAMLLHKMGDAMRPEAGNQTLKLVLLAVALVPLALSPLLLARSLPQDTFQSLLLYVIVILVLVVIVLPRAIEACRPGTPLPRHAEYTLAGPEQRDAPITIANDLDESVNIETMYNKWGQPRKSATVLGKSNYVAHGWTTPAYVENFFSAMAGRPGETHPGDRTIRWNSNGNVLWSNEREAKIKDGQTLTFQYTQ
eukprot:TRINITY_DN12596_c0_g2_i2.p1 TRINITY_DN12596_c0_g2~~TRINITY_DN12596_c0_g2_i2.p1  ORF type:complete len:262 (+),score=16.15 TRINITY_DN12596_c0_g2_i2:73-858(+)